MMQRKIIVGMTLMALKYTLRFFSTGMWVEKPYCRAIDTNALQILALTEKLISISFRDSILSVPQHLTFDSKEKKVNTGRSNKEG